MTREDEAQAHALARELGCLRALEQAGTDIAERA